MLNLKFNTKLTKINKNYVKIEQKNHKSSRAF